MGVSDLQFDCKAGPVMDLSARGMQKLEPSLVCSDNTHTLILDRNHIMKLDHLERSPGLQQLSVAGNRLVRMMGVCRLTELRVLNLPNNSIGYIEGLRDLSKLEWLNLSGNNIKVIEQLNNCVSLQHLDLSDNNISNLGDLTKLVALKALLLHGNSITTLRTVPAHLPAHLSILSLAENEIWDLNEVSYLSALHDLEQLSIMSNTCVMATPSLPGFDYRPYIMSWCLSLKVLDGYVVSQKEGLKAEWLYSQGKGRSYRPGQHVQLVQYLATVCPLTSSPALETAEDAKLERILSKQRFHQRQLLEETQGGCSSPPRPTQLNVKKHSPPHLGPQGAAGQGRKTSAPVTVPSTREAEPVVQFNTWVTSDSSRPPLPVIHSPQPQGDSMCLEDMQADEDKLNSSVLSSDSTLLCLTSDLEPQATHSDSEDETETFEPDSLAPKCPPQPKKHTTKKTHHTPLVKEQERAAEEDVVFPASGFSSGSPATSAGSVGVNPQTAQTHLEETSDGSKEEDGKQEESVMCVSKSSLEESNRAAVKIQAWWRGQFTRCCHPVAKEVRSEIRLRRMQDHILFLSERLDRVQKQCEEEKLQRLVQEEAVKFLWKQLQMMQQWKQSVEQQLSSITQVPSPAQFSAPAPPAVSSTACTSHTDASFPDSGFQSTSEQQPALSNSFLSNGTADSLDTVRTLSPVCGSCAASGDGADSPDGSLLDQYLSSVQQRDEEEEEDDEEEETVSNRTETPLAPSPSSPSKTSESSPPVKEAAGPN
ncbi:centrosomal protein of 97 kDa isoform X2 [Thalassophryne amazonica]|uniref:centrosomal protein of 97 kDa isoform X2 n=1 Tax=Thalassophryne amazonica TaxID=390379 RepID=UPI00147240E8|nr:centrosomal protein of 97 kDa isoform X2 [Thalassophryne amazonica]